MKKALRVIAVSTVLSFGIGSANADVTVLPGTVSSIASIETNHIPGLGTVFNDEIQFSVTAGATQIIANAVTLDLPGFLGIEPLTVTLYSGPNGDHSSPIGSVDQTTQGVSFGTGPFPLTLAPGIYHLDFDGMTTEVNGGFYSVAIAAVPEPETYAMLLVGLGLIGFAARRRKHNFN